MSFSWSKREKLQSFITTSMVSAVCFPFMHIFRLWKLPSISGLLRFLSVMNIEFCQILACVCVYINMIVWISFNSLLMWWITWFDFWQLNQPCITQINPSWSWWSITLLVYCCIWLPCISLRISVCMAWGRQVCSLLAMM